MRFVDSLHCCVQARWPLVRVLTLLIPLLAASGNSVAGNVNLAWDPVATATGYRLHYGTSSGNYSSSVDAKNQTTITVFALTDGTTYFFAVTAYNSATTSGFSNEVTAVPASSPSPFPDTTPPAQPKNLRITVQ
jgi:fibronectin type 3 domain-containing protein